MSGSERKFYVVGMNEQVRAMIVHKGGKLIIKEDKLDEADAVVFTGGEDVTPFLYGEQKHPRTSFNYRRDMREINIYKRLKLHQVKIGICRGAQFLNVMNGGRLWQDVDNHGVTGGHPMRTRDGRIIQVTSTHHQMMIPGEFCSIWGKANVARRKENETDGILSIKEEGRHEWDDVEVVDYYNTNTLCYQPHPEYRTGECCDYFWDCVDVVFKGAKIDKDKHDEAMSKVSAGKEAN